MVISPPSTWFLVYYLLYLCSSVVGIQSRRLETTKYHYIDVIRRFMLKSFICHLDNLQQMFGSLGWTGGLPHLESWCVTRRRSWIDSEEVRRMLKLLGLWFLFVTLSLQQKDPVKDFCRRFAHQSAVINRRLYIDGGFVNWNPISQNRNNYTSKFKTSICRLRIRDATRWLCDVQIHGSCTKILTPVLRQSKCPNCMPTWARTNLYRASVVGYYGKTTSISDSTCMEGTIQTTRQILPTSCPTMSSTITGIRWEPQAKEYRASLTEVELRYQNWAKVTCLEDG